MEKKTYFRKLYAVLLLTAVAALLGACHSGWDDTAGWNGEGGNPGTAAGTTLPVVDDRIDQEEAE